MADEVLAVQAYYDQFALKEWDRLGGFSFEFEITKQMMEKRIKPGSRILDIGGGPGRYALHFAAKGCDVTLLDLSSANVALAQKKAQEQNLKIKTIVADARDLSGLPLDMYDFIFVMGPLYHLFAEEDRFKVIQEAKNHLTKNGLMFVSFIQMFAGLNYYLSECPEEIIHETELEWFDAVQKDQSWAGHAFTEAFFIEPKEIEPFMKKCGLKKVSLFGQEGITGGNNKALVALPEKERARWLELSLNLCEKKQYITHANHILYIGKVAK
jgi:2-polyprenyl-3-methyl-5-hydroxy-6-metoxy-1,4-benzoquinol methylase